MSPCEGSELNKSPYVRAPTVGLIWTVGMLISISMAACCKPDSMRPYIIIYYRVTVHTTVIAQSEVQCDSEHVRV